jgi:hypothetical protein
MNDNNKSECIESVVRILERTEAWRRTLSIRFQNDPRNLRSAEVLNQLAKDAANLTDDQWLALSPHYNWASEKWRSALNDTARGIGFHIRTKQFDIFLKALLQRLTPVVSVAA